MKRTKLNLQIFEDPWNGELHIEHVKSIDSEVIMMKWKVIR